MTGAEHVVIDVDGQELWFAQIHIAEIQALLQLENDIKSGNTLNDTPKPLTPDEEGNQAGLSVYSAYKGKQIKRRDGFLGVVADVNGDYLVVKVLKGAKAGEETKIQLSFITKNPGVYQFVDAQ